MKNIINKAAFVVIILAVLFLLVTVVKNNAERDRQEAIMLKLKADNTAMSTLITSQGDIISIQEQRIFTSEEARKANLLDIAELKAQKIKDVSTIIKLENEVKRLKLELSYNTDPEIIVDTVYIKDTMQLNTYLKVPLGFQFNDDWTTVKGVVKSTGVTIDELITRSQGTIMMGYSTGFFKKSHPIITYKDNNPHITTTAMQNTVIIQRPPFYKTPLWHRLEGAAGAYLIIRGAQRVFN